jgi:hypothetical protein
LGCFDIKKSLSLIFNNFWNHAIENDYITFSDYLSMHQNHTRRVSGKLSGDLAMNVTSSAKSKNRTAFE